MYTLGDTIRELRIKQGLTQDGLSDKLNELYGTSINKSMVSKWESNKEEPRLEHARNLAKYFTVSLDFLLGLNDQLKIEGDINISLSSLSKEAKEELKIMIGYLETKHNK